MTRRGMRIALCMLVLCSALLAPVEARVGHGASIDAGYSLVERSTRSTHRQTQSTGTTLQVTLAQLESLPLLSWSEDSTPKTLTPVYSFGVYETSGDLPRSALSTISTSLGTYVRDALNTAYAPDSDLVVVQQVQVVVVTQSTSATSRRLEATTGSQLDTTIQVWFRHEPSPSLEQVETKVAQILMKSDLTTEVVPSIQRLALQSDSLENVNEMFYLGQQTPGSGGSGSGGGTNVPTQEQATAGDGIVPDVPVAAVTKDSSASNDPGGLRDDIPWPYIIPAIIAACVVMICMALFVKHRRQRGDRPDSQRVSGGSSLEEDLALSPGTHDTSKPPQPQPDINLIWDEIAVDEDYHVETTLMEPTHDSRTSTPERTTDYEMSPTTVHDDQSDVFSSIGGTDSVVGTTAGAITTAVGTTGSDPHATTTNATLSSPRDHTGYSSESPRNGDSRSVFSFLSGLASKASTVVASNVSTVATTPQRHGLLIGTPSSGPAANANSTEPKSPYNGAAGGTPHSRVSSLFTFSEEDSDDLMSTSGDERTSPKTATTAGADVTARRAVAAAATSQSLLDTTQSAQKVIATVPSDEELEGNDMRVIQTAPSDEQVDETNMTPDASTALVPVVDAAETATKKASTVSKEAGTVATKPSKKGLGVGLGVGAAAAAVMAPWIKRRSKNSKGDDTKVDDAKVEDTREASVTTTALAENNTLEDEILRPVAEQTPVDTSANNVSHVFDNDAGTDTSKSGLDSPNASLNDSMFGAAANAVPTLTIDDTSVDANHSWCKDSCAFTETEPAHTVTKDVPFYTADEATASPTAKLSADEIAQELKEAEAESKRLKKMSTNWNMGFFGPTLVESPAAASYSNTKRSISLPSPASSRNSHMSDPGPQMPHSPTTLIELQWDDPTQVANNRVKAAAFAGSMAEQTKSTTTTSNSSAERFRMLTKDAKNRRMSSKSAGNADGTDIYQNDTAEHDSIGSSSKGSLSFRRGRGKPMSKAALDQLANGGADSKAAVLETLSIDSPTGLDRVRRHAKNTADDGTTNYQHATMGDWSVDGDDRDDPSVTDSNDNKARKNRLKLNLKHLSAATTQASSKKPPKSPAATAKTPAENTAAHTPRSAVTNSSSISGLSVNSPTNNSEASPSTQLISDLLWLEQKIAATNQSGGSGTPKSQSNVSAARAAPSPNDSLSFASGDQAGDSSRERSNETRPNDTTASFHQSIVCRDCYAPPGKLKIVIHSTKDGPAVHTVKKGSSLEGHIFAGDLITSVDNVDTRSYSAEQVMKMMTAKTRFERKITVLHFDVAEDATASGMDSSG